MTLAVLTGYGKVTNSKGDEYNGKMSNHKKELSGRTFHGFEFGKQAKVF